MSWDACLAGIPICFSMGGNRMAKKKIRITCKCNYQCFYCREYCKNEPELSIEEIIDLCKIAVEEGYDEIQFGGGEPLLYPELEKLIIETKKIAGVCKVSISTNGSLLQNELKKLKAAGIDEIDLHMDVPDAVTYAEITGKSQILNNVLGVIWSSDVGDTVSLIISVYLHQKSKPFLGVMAAIAKRFDLTIQFVELEEYSSACGLDEKNVIQLLSKNIKNLESQGNRIYTSPELKGRLKFI